MSLRYWLLEKLQAINFFLDRLRFQVLTRLGLRLDKPVIVHAYRGYGGVDWVHLSGRVLLDKFIVSRKEDRAWRNFVNSLKRFRSSEVMGARLKVKIGKNKFIVTTDREGYFFLEELLEKPLPPGENMRKAHLFLTHTPWQKVGVTAHAEILTPQAPAFGVISDIDDTILRTGVHSLLKIKMMYRTILQNAIGRQAFEEASHFYQALAQGRDGASENPFFYVSNSPWNLYDLLDDFLHINQLPIGPIFLRDFGIPYRFYPKEGKGHKRRQIARILHAYPDLPFILIGDSGERDADIYLEIARLFPGRILTIYIHDVRSPRRAKRVERLLKAAPNVRALLVHSFEEAAEDAARHGFIAPVE